MRLLGGTGSHVGNVREANQDRVYYGGKLAALADGMGGHQGGERAAELAIGQFRRAGAELSEGDLVDMVLAANRAVHGHAAENGLPGMGTTLVALTLHDDDTMTVANVGDSRAYWIRGDYMTQVTEDHSFVEDLVRQGRLTPAEAATHPQRNILTRAVGIGIEVEVDRFPIEEPAIGDTFLLCSDGLFNEVPEDRILELILSSADPVAAASSLIDTALATPCRDNVTVAVIEVVTDDDPRLTVLTQESDDDGVITSEYLDDTNAITSQIPVIPGAVLRPADGEADGGEERTNGTSGPAGDASPTETGDAQTTGASANGRTAPSAANGVEATANGVEATANGAAEADDEPGNLAVATAVDTADNTADGDPTAERPLDDPQANLPTSELPILADGDVEVRPGSRLLVIVGSVLIAAGLVAGSYFLARSFARSGFFVGEDPASGTLAVMQGREDGLFGLFDPVPVIASAYPPEILAEVDLEAEAAGPFDTRADAEAVLALIDDRVTELQAEQDQAQAEADAAASPSDGTSDSSDADSGSDSTQLTGDGADGSEGEGGDGSSTEGG